MRSLDMCDSCQVGTMLVYVTRRFERHIVRYKRCSSCRCTSKSVQMISENPIESSTNHSRSTSPVNLKSITDEQNQSLEDTKW
jgi:hypothetical protein